MSVLGCVVVVLLPAVNGAFRTLGRGLGLYQHAAVDSHHWNIPPLSLHSLQQANSRHGESTGEEGDVRR